MVEERRDQMANSVIHTSESRGLADHGWLLSRHTFSFANYYDPERIHFGALRVLNDDIVAAGKGFGRHPHDNMEIVSIPLEGDLEHNDSMGNVSVIRNGDIQVMSAGTGIFHSEYNKNTDRPVKFLQIWILPDSKNVTPRYDQVTLNMNDRDNTLQQILAPTPSGGAVWIHQKAWFHMGKYDKGNQTHYNLRMATNGVYIFVLSGDVMIGEQVLHARDGYGKWNISDISIKAVSDTQFLLMEVPMI